MTPCLLFTLTAFAAGLVLGVLLGVVWLYEILECWKDL
jgi:hypothetical protein